MVAREMPIRQQIDTSEFGGITLDLLRTSLGNTKPELVENAAAEFRSAMANLKALIVTLDHHLDAFNKHWTVGEDAKIVKEQLQRIRVSAQSLVDTIVAPAPSGTNPTGVAPALEMYSTTLKAFRGDHVPQNADRDVSFLEGAFQGGVTGAAAGGGVGVFFGGVGAAPGAVIGAVTGTVIGGATSLFTDGPFQNMFGDSKEERDMKAAQKHLKALTAATAQVNEAFPQSVRTDIPEFTPPGIVIPTTDTPPGGPRPGAGVYPPGGGQPYTPALAMNGFTPSFGQGGPDDLRGFEDPNGGVPGAGAGQSGSGTDGSGTDGSGQNGSGQSGSGTDGSGTDGSGQNGSGQYGSGVGGGYPGGAGADGSRGNIPDPAGNSGGDTELAGYNTQLNNLAGGQHLPDNANLRGPAGIGPGNATAGTASPLLPGSASPLPGSTFGHGGGGPGADSRGMSAARGPGTSGSMMPFLPYGGGSANEGNEEHSRSTWLLEDEDLFMSDRPVTSPLINGASKDRR
ncbi:hypothetical protein [Streptosporangium sp. CA-115845]|uniref:hypothetical protein n=1 Tax=Streptosporangium sp. CA-115845 TaxID=3240071 RepID=UPI003D905BF4